ncbi:uncharacterized protein LOC124160180 [Ischnura elegans]|uniref:uncharacterized protein LOC124160180 n=1 Tax=Ischnura elegans TaxID=197161 RepID=UPI001ED87DEF|nr:uncharacterized protein LOC124160180 [Ischnura elegans]
MSEVVDEDLLSVQLESSLTLEDDEDPSSGSGTRESPARSNERRNLLDSLFSPVKVSPFKPDKDLRKEVLIRNLTPKKDKALVKSSHDCTYHMQPEQDLDKLGAKEGAPVEGFGGDIEIVPKSEGDGKIVFEDEDYIVLDETLSVSVEVVNLDSTLNEVEKEKGPEEKLSESVKSNGHILNAESTISPAVEAVKSSSLTVLAKEEQDDSVQNREQVECDKIAISPVGEETVSSTPHLVSEKEEKPTKKPSGLDVDYVSKDPLENADNNNPEWQLLQKLETDEERYKAVRKRWRNLIVPEPNKDLTCFTWCRKNHSVPQSPIEAPKNVRIRTSSEEDINKGRKRTFSACTIDSPIRRGRGMRQTEKRVRTVSCTRVYDDKIATLRRHVSEECLKIDRERMYALEGLEKKFLFEKRSLSNWALNTGYSIYRELNELDRTHKMLRQNVASSYEDLSSQVWEKKASEINTLEAASQEVLAFHKFYQGLDTSAPESMVLTEEQMEEIEEINDMYDAFGRFYEE